MQYIKLAGKHHVQLKCYKCCVDTTGLFYLSLIINSIICSAAII